MGSLCCCCGHSQLLGMMVLAAWHVCSTHLRPELRIMQEPGERQVAAHHLPYVREHAGPADN